MSKEEVIAEALKNIKIRCHSKVVWDDPIDSDLEIIEQALLKAQEQEKKNAKYKDLEEQLEYPFEVMVKALKYGFAKSDKLDEKISLAQTMKNFLHRIEPVVSVGTYIDGDNYCIKFYDGWRKEKVIGWIGTTEEEFYQYREMFKELENKE